MILFAIAYLITGALAQTGTKIALDNVDSVNAPTALGDLLEQEYVDEGCEKAGWGPFPNASSTSLTAEAYSKAHGASGCKVGAHRREQHRGGIVPRQTLRAQASPARRPSVSDVRRDRP
jgi:hypothetical protein